MGIITNFFGVILNGIFELISTVTPVATLGISIIVFTLIAQLLFTPLKLRQQHSMRAMNRIQPELQKIQKKYGNKKDQASQMAYSQEVQALYKKHNANPLSGCLPLLIQLPLIYGLYNVLRQPSSHIRKLGDLYSQLATTLQEKVTNITDIINEVIIQVPLSSNATLELDRLDSPTLADTLSHFTTQQWNVLEASITPEQFSSLAALLEQKQDYEWFLVNLIDSPAQLFGTIGVLALIIPVISGASTFLFSKVSMANQTARSSQGSTASGDSAVANQTESMMKTMNIMMPVMMGFISWSVPVGLALYWAAGNVIMMFQQVIIARIVDKKEDELDAKFKAQQEAAKMEAATKKKKKKKKPVVEGQITEETSNKQEEKQLGEDKKQSDQEKESE